MIRHISSNLSSRTSDVIIICKSWISILHAFCAPIYSWNSARDVHCRLWSTWPDFSLKYDDEKFRRMTHFIASFIIYFSPFWHLIFFKIFDFDIISFHISLSQFHCIIIMVDVNLMFTMQNNILCCHIPIISVQEHVLLPCYHDIPSQQSTTNIDSHAHHSLDQLIHCLRRVSSEVLILWFKH